MSLFDTLKTAFNDIKAGSTNLLAQPTDQNRVAGPFGMPQVAPPTVEEQKVKFDAAKVKGAENAGKVNNFAKAIANGMLSTALDVGEAPVRAAGAIAGAFGSEKGTEIATKVVPPREFPSILGKWLGPMQSYSSKIAEDMSQGKSATGGLVDFALNEPAGVAFKPVIAGLGIIAKPLAESLGLTKNIFKDISKTSDATQIEGMLPDTVPNKAELSQKLSAATDPTTVERIIDDHIKTTNPALLGKEGGVPNVSQIEAHANDYRQTGKVNDFGPAVETKAGSTATKEEAQQLPKFLREETSAYNKEVYNTPDNPSIVEAAANTGDKPSVVSRVADNLRNLQTKFLETFQDTDIRVKNMIEKAGTTVDDSSNIYQKMTLYSGKVGKMVEDGKVATESTIKEMKTIADDLKTDLKTVRKDVNEYLIARHAPERNAVVGEGGAGIGTKEAEARVKAIESSPEGKRIVAVADKIQELNNKTLDMLHDSGVINKETYDKLRKTYKNHVPLNRIMDSEDDIGSVLSGKGFDVKSTGLKRAKGSEREVSDVLGNVITNYEQAVLRSQKNLVDNATLDFIRKNKDIIGDELQIVKPKIVGKTHSGKPIFEQTNDPSVLQMFEDGKKVWVKIKDPNLAIALRGVGREKLGTFLNAVGSFTRFYSGLATRFNPEFALPNKLRDLQETATYLASQKDIGFKGAASMVAKDVTSYKAVLDGLRGADTEGARLYNEMRDMGGTTGGMGLSTKKATELNLEKLEKLANSKGRQTVENIVEYIDGFNTIFEDSTRLSVYKQALESGASKERAAFLAKEASINFNRMGKAGPVVNALYMFANASIQGSTKMIRALKNPKVLGAVTLGVSGAVAAVNEWNDHVDPKWRDKVTKYDRLNALPVVMPSSDGGVHYFTIPVSWGMKPIKVMADYAYDALSGQKFDPKKFVNDTMTATVNAYNPLGGTDWLSTVSPTILDTPVDIERNTSWNGGKIRPDFNKNAPDDIQYFDSLDDTKTGKAAINISEVLHDKADISISPANIKYGFEQYTGGAGRFAGKLFNLGASANEKGPLPSSEYPFLSRFYKSRTEEEVGAGAGGSTEDISNLLSEQERTKFKVKKEAEAYFKELKAMPKEQANAEVATLKKSNPQIYDKIKQIASDEKKGLNYQERLMGQLGVENGERAKYIYNTVSAMGTKEEKNAYIEDLKKKGLVTKNVVSQLRVLVKNK